MSEMKNDASSDSTRGPGVLYRNDGAHSRTGAAFNEIVFGVL